MKYLSQRAKAIETAAQQAFTQTAAGGDVNGLKASAIPSLQSNFTGIAGAVSDNKDAVQGAKPRSAPSICSTPAPAQDRTESSTAAYLTPMA